MRFRIRPLFLCLLLALFALSGCAQVDSAYKSTKKFYFTHINKPATLDVSDRTELEAAERALVTRIMTIDEELSKLEKALDAFSIPPDGQAAANLLRRFPWLSGLAMIAPDGTLGASIPPAPLKQLDYSPLLEPSPKAMPRDLRSFVQDTPLGPEIVIGRPFIVGDELKVLLAATFDFRALLPFAGSPGDLIVRSPDVLIWSGDVDYASTPMASIDWNELLKEQTSGELSSDSMNMLWVTRFIGGKPLIFASGAQ